MNVSLRQIEVFLAVARTMSFSQAARLCHLSQPALSANIKRLEETLGARLFDRHTRKVALTAVGREFLAIAAVLTDNMGLALARVQDFVAGKRGRLVVAAAPSMAASFVPQVIAEFARAHPDIEIELHDELSGVCVEMVRSGAADVALAPFKSDADDLRQLELFRDPLLVICPAAHPLTQRASVRWRDVQSYAHIVMNGTSGVRQLVDAEFAQHHVRLLPAFEVAHVSTMLGLIAAGLGIGELPRSLVQNVDLAGLAQLSISSSTAYRTLCAITVMARTEAPTVEPFIRLCQQHAKRKAMASEGGSKTPSARRQRSRAPTPASASR